MSRAQNIHDTNKWKKKKHPMTKCGNAKCLICHSDKVFELPDRQLLRANDKANFETQQPQQGIKSDNNEESKR